MKHFAFVLISILSLNLEAATLDKDGVEVYPTMALLKSMIIPQGISNDVAICEVQNGETDRPLVPDIRGNRPHLFNLEIVCDGAKIFSGQIQSPIQRGNVPVSQIVGRDIIVIKKLRLISCEIDFGGPSSRCIYSR